MKRCRLTQNEQYERNDIFQIFVIFKKLAKIVKCTKCAVLTQHLFLLYMSPLRFLPFKVTSISHRQRNIVYVSFVDVLWYHSDIRYRPIYRDTYSEGKLKTTYLVSMYIFIKPVWWLLLKNKQESYCLIAWPDFFCYVTCSKTVLFVFFISGDAKFKLLHTTIWSY